MKPYVVVLIRNGKVLLMSTHNICFRPEIRKILCEYPLSSIAMLKVISSLMHIFCRDWIKLLVEAGSSLDFVYQIPVSTTPLFDITIAEYAPDFFKTLENCGSMTPLISAIHHSDFGLTKFLLQNKASSNLADSNGVTPLMHAVRQVSRSQT